MERRGRGPRLETDPGDTLVGTPPGGRSHERPTSPWCVVVAGVSGVGKSTVAEKIAVATGARLADGDDFHSAAAVGKMHDGSPLDEADRRPWLERIGEWIDAQHQQGTNAVITCSALRRVHRDILTADRAWVRICLLLASPGTTRERISARTGHFMPASLLPTQLRLLESLEPDEPGTTVDATDPAEQVAATALRELGLS